MSRTTRTPVASAARALSGIAKVNNARVAATNLMVALLWDGRRSVVRRWKAVPPTPAELWLLGDEFDAFERFGLRRELRLTRGKFPRCRMNATRSASS